MGINWNNIIKDQARGVDPVTAFMREEDRRKEENRRQMEEEQRRRKSRGNRQ